MVDDNLSPLLQLSTNSINKEPSNAKYALSLSEFFNDTEVIAVDIQREYKNLSLFPEQCGRVLEFKHFNGNRTELGDFPWITLLEYRTRK